MRTASLLIGPFLLVAIGLASASASADAADWLTLPSTYSHDPQTGMRVSQFAAAEPAVAPGAPNFRSSGYTHTRSTLAYGQSADNYHRVEEWGAPVRPYGEWRFPYRPYSTPYPNWGPPYAGLNLGLGGFGPAGPRGNWPHDGQGDHANPINPYPAGPGSPYPVAPYYDGYYPPYGN